MDECGVCGGSGYLEGFCDCDGGIEDMCGDCIPGGEFGDGWNDACTGCMDEDALNYDQEALVGCNNCCLYEDFPDMSSLNLQSPGFNFLENLSLTQDPPGTAAEPIEIDITLFDNDLDDNTLKVELLRASFVDQISIDAGIQVHSGGMSVAVVSENFDDGGSLSNLWNTTELFFEDNNNLNFIDTAAESGIDFFTLPDNVLDTNIFTIKFVIWWSDNTSTDTTGSKVFKLNFTYRDCVDLGDINGDDQFNVLDVVPLANCILANNCAELGNACAGDMDGGGNYNVLDIVQLANCILADNCGG